MARPKKDDNLKAQAEAAVPKKPRAPRKTKDLVAGTPAAQPTEEVKMRVTVETAKAVTQAGIDKVVRGLGEWVRRQPAYYVARERMEAAKRGITVVMGPLYPPRRTPKTIKPIPGTRKGNKVPAQVVQGAA